MTLNHPSKIGFTSLLKELRPGAEVLDYGCFGWRVQQEAVRLGRADLKLTGCDFIQPAAIPAGASFLATNHADSSIPCADDKFDLIIASHVIEHISDPIRFFTELTRICKPGGKIYIEAPSDYSIHTKSSADVEDQSFLSFWDDPTHIRPWTPAALYRLGISFGFHPLACAYSSSVKGRLLYPFKFLWAKLTKDGELLTTATWDAHKWCCYATFEKPVDILGKAEYRYITLKEIPRGVENALELYKKLK